MVRMRCFLVLVGLLSLGATHASTCTTVTSGPFTDVNVWDCGCDPIACDTLIIAHAVTIDVDITLNPTQLVIQTNGELLSSAELSLSGSVVNNGHLFSSSSIILSQSAAHLRNTGLISCGSMTLSCDSASNNGSLTVQNVLLLNECILDNTGNLNSGTTRTWTFATLINSGSFTSDSLLYMTTLYVLPEGELSTGYLLSTALVLNEGAMDVDNAQLLNLDNLGQLHGSELLQLGTETFLGNVTMRPNSVTTSVELLNFGSATFQTNSLATLAKLENQGAMNGHGTICISDSSINHGTVLGSLRICDATSMDGAGGFDINTGTISPTVTYCSNSSCTWTSLSDQASTPAIHITPNPAVDALTIQLGASLPAVHRIEIRDLGGRLVQQVDGPITERIVLHRNGLVAGTYLIRVMRTNGEVPATQMVVFTD
jgi:hypothetical protein